MSQTTPNAPMLLDSTGQAIVNKLNGIKSAIENGGGGGGGGSCPAYLKPQAYDASVARYGNTLAYRYGDYCDYEGTPYRCISSFGIDVEDPVHAFDLTEWEEVTNFINELALKPGRVINGQYGSESFGQIGSNTSSSNYSHAEGQSTQATGIAAHAEGQSTRATGSYSHAEGQSSYATQSYAHAEGSSCQATGSASHAEGYNSVASGDYSHAEGYSRATQAYAHAEGGSTEATGTYSHAEGYGTQASQSYTHAEGSYTKANGYYTHAEGNNTEAKGESSHAEGYNTKAYASRSHAEGYGSIAGDQNDSYKGTESHAEGYSTRALGNYSHAQGNYTQANGMASHAGGNNSIANGSCSMVMGDNLTANSNYEAAFGTYNQSSVAPPANAYAYNPNASYYSVGMKVLYNNDGNVYECVTEPPKPAGAFDPTYWNIIDTYDPNPIIFSYGNGTYGNPHNLFEIRKDGTGYFNGNPILSLAPPSTNGTYVLKATVSNGIVTYSWVQEV